MTVETSCISSNYASIKSITETQVSLKARLFNTLKASFKESRLTGLKRLNDRRNDSNSTKARLIE